MATNFPGGLDALPNPGPNTPMNTPGALEHDLQHANENDAIVAIETKLGINGSGDASSVDAKLTTVIAAQATDAGNIGTLQTQVTALQGTPTNSNVIFAASGNFTTANLAGAKAVRVRVWGPGGGGGGVINSAAVQTVVAAGGGSGWYCESIIPAGSLSLPAVVTVGTVGAAGANTGGNGGNATASSFAAQVVAPGGLGGQGSTTSAVTTQVTAAGGGTGAGPAGDIQIKGGNGGNGFRFSGTSSSAGEGAAAPLGGGASLGNTGQAAGTTGSFPGGGGGGALSSNAVAAAIGGAGAAGLVVVELLY